MFEDTSSQIRISGTVQDSIVDGTGLRYVIFTQGCNHKCKGCQNPQTWDYTGGKLVYTSDLIKEIRNNPLADGITFSGGEPLDQADALLEIAEWGKSHSYNIWCYTGYAFEDIQHLAILKYIDVLVDGEFKEAYKHWDCKYRGSTNQRVIDVQTSLKSGAVVLLPLIN